jgi:[ribosomal protein S18]-alanine N-acetyltransferase
MIDLICRPSPDLIEACFNLEKEFMAFPWSHKAWMDFFQKEAPLFVIQTPREIMGFALFQYDAEDSYAHLLKIVVKPTYRKQGFASRLLVEAETHFHRHSLKRMGLEVEEENQAAQKLYFKHGFTVSHKIRGFYSQGQTAIVMHKVFQA